MLLLGLAGCGDGPLTGDAGGAADASHIGDGTVSEWPPLEASAIGAPVLVGATFQFAEGPLWDPRRSVLLFSDIGANVIRQLTPPDRLEVFRSPSHQANGLGFDRAGLLLAAEHESRSVTRTLADGTIQTVADAYQGKRLNSPNDLIVRSDGTIYFTDPTYGLGMRPSDLGFTGLFRVAPDGTLALEAKIDGAPNGVALAPGERTLYVAATTAGAILAFDLAADGTTSNQRKLPQAVDSPDGLAVDRAGDLYVAARSGGQGAVVVLDPTGALVGAIPLDHAPTNCGFGGADGKTLFVTAREALYRLATPIPGL